MSKQFVEEVFVMADNLEQARGIDQVNRTEGSYDLKRTRLKAVKDRGVVNEVFMPGTAEPLMDAIWRDMAARWKGAKPTDLLSPPPSLTEFVSNIQRPAEWPVMANHESIYVGPTPEVYPRGRFEGWPIYPDGAKRELPPLPAQPSYSPGETTIQIGSLDVKLDERGNNGHIKIDGHEVHGVQQLEILAKYGEPVTVNLSYIPVEKSGD